MPPTIAAGLLPPPHAITRRDGTVVRRSTIGRLPFHGRPDPELHPQALTLAWGFVPAATAVAIDRLCEEHPHDIVTLTVPGTGEQLRVQPVGRPTIQWDSAAFASSVTLDVDEVLVSE